MSALFLFLYDVLSHWVSLMGIASLSITLLLRARGYNPRNKIFWSIAAFCFLIAFFLTWRDEHVALDKTQKELADAKDQKAFILSAHIERVVVEEEPDAKGTQIFLLLSIRNVGNRPSVAEKYKLRIETGSFQYSGEPQKIEKEYSLAHKTQEAPIRPEDSLVKKTDSPIAVGQRESGWLTFIVPNVKPDSIRQPGMKFTVSFTDISGKSYLADYNLPVIVK